MTPGSEIERKYLLADVPPAVTWQSEHRIRQGYIALDGDTEVRVRVREDGATLTIKHGGGRARIEEELPLDERQAEALWAITGARRLEKVRRVAQIGGHAVEVDEYEGDLRGLLVAEVEFPDEPAADAFEPPAWFGREVTGHRAYRNRSLACRGRPPEGG